MMGNLRPPRGEVPAKIGTVPAIVIFDRRIAFELGARVRFREVNRFGRRSDWKTGTLIELDPIKISR